MTDNDLDAQLTAAINKLPKVQSIREADLAKLAREIAMDLRDLSDILRDYGLDETGYQKDVLSNAFFKRLLDAYIQEWNSAVSTHQRLRLQSAMALEYSLPKLAARMNKDGETLPAVVEAAKFFSRVAGVGEGPISDGTEGRIKITIDLGADRKLEFEKDAAAMKTIDALPAIETEKE